MNTSLKNISKMVALAAALACVGFAHAGTATANLTVSANVIQNCSITTTPVAFGAYDPVSGGNLTAAGTVVIACTKAATGLSLGLGYGANAVGTQRNLLGTASSDKLAYSLLQPTTNAPLAACPAFAAGTAWSTTSALTLTSPTSKSARTYNVCGQLASGQDVSVDSYSDTVVATINF